MTSGGGATAWCCHLLAIASAGSAVFTYLVIKDPSHDVVKIASKVNRGGAGGMGEGVRVSYTRNWNSKPP